MQKIFTMLVILGTFLFIGCFNEKSSEDKAVKGDEIITAILELVNNPQTKQTASEVQNVSNGVYSGIYLKIGTTMYMYSFTDLESLDSPGKLDFISRWASASDSNSYIILENKAVSLATAKLVFATNGAKLSTAMLTGLDSSDAGFAIHPTTMVVVYPKAVNSTLSVRADRNIGTKQIGSARYDWMSGMTIDNNGSVYALMYYDSDYELDTDGVYGGKIIKYNKKGEEWSKEIKGNAMSYLGTNTSEIRLENIGSDSQGNIYVGGK